MAFEKNSSKESFGFFKPDTSLTTASAAVYCRQIDQGIIEPMVRLFQHRGGTEVYANLMKEVQTSTNEIRKIAGLETVLYEQNKALEEAETSTSMQLRQ